MGETSDNEEFISQEKRRKRQRASPFNSTQAGSSGRMYSAAVSARPAQVPTRTINKPKTVIGASSNSTLKASKTLIMKKSVYRLGNIDCSNTACDVETFVKSLGVRILTCFELNKTKNQPDDNKAFRLCICAEDKDKLCNEENWDVGVSLREWVHKPKVNLNSNTDVHTGVNAASATDSVTAMVVSVL